MRRASPTPAWGGAVVLRRAPGRLPPSSATRRRPRRARLVACLAGVFAALAGCAWLVRRVALCDLDTTAAPLGADVPFPPYARAAGDDGAARVDFVWVSAFPASLVTSVRTVCHFFDTSSAGAFHVIVPDDMAPYFSRVASLLQCAPTGAGGAARAPVQLRVWPESRLVPRFTRGAPHRGSVRQMVLKLAAAFVVTSPWYVVLDSDVFARAPFNASSLLPADGAGGARRAATAFDDPLFPQKRSWHAEAARVLRSGLVRDTYVFCAAGGGGSLGAGGLALLDAARPFALAESGGSGGGGGGGGTSGSSGGRTVYGACLDGRGAATHVTPMTLSAELVQRVLAPRLALVGGGEWYDVLLDYHARRARACPEAWLPGRFYTWTEYGLYFVAAVAAGALDDFHSFAGGGTVALQHSAMLPAAYDAMDWGAVFDDAAEQRPFFVAHSWFGRPLAPINAALAARVPAMADPAAWELPAAPSPHAAYDDRDALAPAGAGEGGGSSEGESEPPQLLRRRPQLGGR